MFNPIDRPVGNLYTRIGVCTFSVILLGLLLTASQLTPSEKGFGTHQQLGLNPCASITWFGVQCPTCGMTTSWSNLMHGRVWNALKANVPGSLLACLGLVTAPVMIYSSAKNKWPTWWPREVIWSFIGVAFIILLFLDWIRRIGY